MANVTLARDDEGIAVIAWDMQDVDRQFFAGTLGTHPAHLLPLKP